jgi:hypothetical protein
MKDTAACKPSLWKEKFISDLGVAWFSRVRHTFGLAHKTYYAPPRLRRKAYARLHAYA